MLCADPLCEVREAEVNPYSWALGAAVGLGLLIGAFFFGRSTGIDHQKAVYAKAEAKAIAAMEKGRQAIETVSGQLATARRDQDTETRTIYHEATRIIERQSVAVCIDAGGIGLLDRARANANRTLARLPYDLPAGDTVSATQ